MVEGGHSDLVSSSNGEVKEGSWGCTFPTPFLFLQESFLPALPPSPGPALPSKSLEDSCMTLASVFPLTCLRPVSLLPLAA